MSIDPQKPEPLYRQIVNDIKEKVIQGDLKSGDQLPKQIELAGSYQVSMITVKKALSDLSKEGVIYSRAGKGTYIATPANHVDFQKHRTIGFVLRDLDSPFFSGILIGAEKKLSEEEYNLLLSSSAGKSEKEESMIRHLMSIGVSGLIIASMSREYKATPIINEVHQANFPYVVVSYMADKDISCVGIDHEAGAFMATTHLIKLGYRDIAYINGIHGDKGSLLGNLRKQGYLRALREHNVEYNPGFEYLFQLRGEWFDFQSGYEIGLGFVKNTKKPQAVFAFDDLTALGFQKALLENHMRIPEDVALVGFDDIRRGVSAPVPLTTIHQPTLTMGEMAVDMVLKKITGQPVEVQRILKPSLVVRESCGARLHGYTEINANAAHQGANILS